MRLDFRSILLLLLSGVLFGGCVEAGEFPWEPLPDPVDALPGGSSWVDDTTGVTAGWEINIPEGALAEAQVFTLAPLSASASPTHKQGYELIAAAAILTPREVTFAVPIEVRIPITTVAKGTARVLLAPDSDHLAAGFWDFGSVVTDGSFLSLELPISTSMWPVQVSTPPPAQASTTLPTVCVNPFEEDAINSLMEEPEQEGECAGDQHCVLSGCQNEVCAPTARSSLCLPAPRICARCGCIAGVCRWIK